MSIKAVAFDVDGTIYPSYKLYKKLFLRGLFNGRLLLSFNKVRHEIRSAMYQPDYAGSNIKTVDEFHIMQAELVAKHMGISASVAYNKIEHFFYTTARDTFSAIELYDGVTSLLSMLKSKGIKTGALSDFPCDEKLKLLGIFDLFDVSMTSEETGFVKPHIASFDLLANRLGVKNSEVMYVGNSEKYDVAGAIQAGMRAALIKHNHLFSKKSQAEFVFYQYKKLADYLEPLL